MTRKAAEAVESRAASADPRRPAGLLPSVFSIFISLLWGGLPVSIKTSLKYGAPLQIGWMRFTLGGLVTLTYMVARKESFRLEASEIRPILIVSLLFSVQLVFMNVGQDLTTAGHATAIGTTMPIWAATIAQIMIPSERLNLWKAIAIALSYAGVLAVVFGDDAGSAQGVSLLGDLLSLVSAILLGLRIVLISNFAQNVSESKLMMGQQIIGTILFLIASYALESPVYTLNSEFWLALAYQGLVIAGFGFLANAWLVKRYLPSTITFFYFVMPVAGVALAWLILGEDPGRGLIAGMVLVCLGALVYGGETYIKARRPSERAA